jgi:hypothetical protein
MSKYLIIAPKVATESPSGKPLFCYNAILGTIVARSKIAATKKAIELTGIDDPIVLNFTSLDDSELEMAELAPILDSPNPVGRPPSGHRRSLTLTGLTDADVAKLDSVDCKGAYMVGLLRKDIATDNDKYDLPPLGWLGDVEGNEKYGINQ